MNQSNCIVAQSGGPTVAINASLAGVIAGVKSSEKYDICYGAVNGILGILNENYLNLSDIFSNEANLEKLKTTPAMYLGSCRHKLPDYKDDDSPYVYIFHQFDKLSVKAFFYIGGNDSMDTVYKLSIYCKENNIDDIKVMGAPKTIDNDL
ncbi:MAG TPA: 6-phosphofructokinase, partial [Eubacterium sp.]|nr:6-phosphofructokinase [Eubacterium sp.]